MILVLVPKSPKRRSDTAAPPPPPSPHAPALSLLSPWEVLWLKVAHVPMGKMTWMQELPISFKIVQLCLQALWECGGSCDISADVFI